MSPLALLVLALQDSSSSPSDVAPMPAPAYVRLPKNFQWTPPQYGGTLGSSVAIGDVDGDGIGDIVAGAPWAGGQVGSYTAFEGLTFVFNGATFDTMAILELPQAKDHENAGAEVACADFDSDGRAEVVVGTVQQRTVVFRGGGLEPTLEIPYGCEALAVGDWNGDGVPDLAIGLQLVTAAGRVFFGPDLTASVPLPVLSGTIASNNLAVGDLNNDGKDDVLLADTYANYGRGSCWFTLAPDLTSTQQILDPRPMNGGHFGKSLAVADFNGDGLTDLVATSERTECEWLCRDTLLYAGPGFKDHRQITDYWEGYRYGLGVYVSANDVNHDGFEDLVTVAAHDIPGALAVPEFYAYLGPALTGRIKFYPPDRDQRDEADIPNVLVSFDSDGDGWKEFFAGDFNGRVFGGGGEPAKVVSGVVHVFDFSVIDPVSSYGYGSLGSGGIEPMLTANGSARVGSVLEIAMAGGLGGATGSLVSGSQSTSVLLCETGSFAGKSAYLRVVPSATLPIVLDGAAGAPGGGTFTMRVVIPNDPLLAWQSVYYQAIVDDPQGPCRTAVTRGLQISIQP